MLIIILGKGESKAGRSTIIEPNSVRVFNLIVMVEDVKVWQTVATKSKASIWGGVH